MAKKDKVVETEESDDNKTSSQLSKALIKELNKSSKEKVAWCLGTDADNPTEVKEFISFGSTLLDYISTNRENGGVPVGKLTEIVGEEASGKSLVCAHLLAECQRRDGLAVYIDTENAAHPPFMQQLGVDINKLVYLQPGTCEEVGDAIEKVILLTRAKAPNRLVLIVWDSIAGTPTKTEIEGSYELNMNMQLEKSKVLSKMMRKLTETLGKERIALVFTNQLKVKIGVLYGDPMTTPGGKAIPYHASLRIRLNRGGQNSDEKTKQIYGINTTAKVIKSRLGPPLRSCKFNIMFKDGIDDVASWFDYLHARGEIEKAAGWCYFTSFPSGKSDKESDRGIQFRESGWSELVNSNPDFKKHVLGRLNTNLIVRYDQKEMSDIDLDPESFMDSEAVIEHTANSK